jgi:GT2 family glycosyltransferase
MTRPDCSVIIVNWNGLGILRDCLESVVANTSEREAEVIVIDNASDDGSPEMVEAEFPRVRLIRNRANRGFAAANNQGLAVARGRYPLLLNSDTVVLGDVIQRSAAYMDAHPDVGGLGCRVLNPDRTMQPTCFQYPSLFNLALWASGLTSLPGRFFGRQTYRGWERDSERDVDVVTGCYLMIRREILETVGPLDERFFFFGEETDWCRSIAEAGWKVRFAPVGEIVHIGNASGKKHSHRRDFMLAAGLVRLHAKRSGRLAGRVAGRLCQAYWATRWLAYSLRLLFSRDPDLRERRDRFGRILAGYPEVWKMAEAEPAAPATETPGAPSLARESA